MVEASQCPVGAGARKAQWLTFGDAHISCVVFLDSGDGAAPSGRALRHPRGAPVADLIAAAAARLQVDRVR